MPLGGDKARAVAAALVLVASFSVATVLADGVSGKVALSGSGLRTNVESIPAYWSVWNGALPYQSRRKNPTEHLSVVLVSPGSEKMAGCDYRLENGNFLPRTIVAPAGKSVSVLNRDLFHYNIRQDGKESDVSPANKLMISAPAKGESTILGDENLPHVRGIVVGVEGVAACADVDKNGSYRFADVAAGSYTLKAFWDGRQVASKPIEISGDELVVEQFNVRVESGAN